MSLKFFHLFFIVVSILLSFFFGFWSLQNYYAGESIYLAYAIASFIAAAALIWYAPRVALKLKNIGFFILCLALLKVTPAFACATCYGDPNNPTSHGLVAAILVLLGFIGAILGLVLALIIYYNMRSRDLVSRG